MLSLQLFGLPILQIPSEKGSLFLLWKGESGIQFLLVMVDLPPLGSGVSKVWDGVEHNIPGKIGLIPTIELVLGTHIGNTPRGDLELISWAAVSH